MTFREVIQQSLRELGYSEEVIERADPGLTLLGSVQPGVEREFIEDLKLIHRQLTGLSPAERQNLYQKVNKMADEHRRNQ